MTGSNARLGWLLAAVLAVGLAAELAGGLAWPVPDGATPTRQAAQANAPPGTAADTPVLLDSAMLLRRPLFTPGRRPDDPAIAAAPVGPGLVQPPRLAGILLTGSGRSAIFAAASGNGHAAVVVEGGSLGPWRVEAIGAGGVLLSGPDGRRTVRPTYSDVSSDATPGGLLPTPVQPDTNAPDPTQPPGAAGFINTPVPPAARTFP